MRPCGPGGEPMAHQRPRVRTTIGLPWQSRTPDQRSRDRVRRDVPPATLRGAKIWGLQSNATGRDYPSTGTNSVATSPTAAYSCLTTRSTGSRKRLRLLCRPLLRTPRTAWWSTVARTCARNGAGEGAYGGFPHLSTAPVAAHYPGSPSSRMKTWPNFTDSSARSLCEPSEFLSPVATSSSRRIHSSPQSPFTPSSRRASKNGAKSSAKSKPCEEEIVRRGQKRNSRMSP